jgi:hypothetical protein
MALMGRASGRVGHEAVAQTTALALLTVCNALESLAALTPPRSVEPAR